MDVEAAQAGVPESLGMLLEHDGVGGERDVVDIGYGCEFPDQPMQIAAQQRLTAREPNLVNALRHADANEALDLLEGQDVFARRIFRRFFRHAVEAADVAAIRHTDAQTVMQTAEIVDERHFAYASTLLPACARWG